MNRAEFVDKVAEDISVLSTWLDDYGKRFKEDPAWNLAAAGTAFENAAERGVLSEIWNRLGAGTSIADVKAEALRHVVDGARFPSRSNLPCVNLMAQCKAKAWGDIANFMSIVKDE